jgi:hypothetical protein
MLGSILVGFHREYLPCSNRVANFINLELMLLGEHV